MQTPILTNSNFWMHPLFGALAAAALVACSGETDTSTPTGPGAGGSSEMGGTGGMAGSAGAADQPDEACMAFCALSDPMCSGPDLEYASSSTITETTPTGCSLTVELPFSGTVEVNLDCTQKEACVEQGSGCLGSPGECYTAEASSEGNFWYLLPNCINGSLDCWSE